MLALHALKFGKQKSTAKTLKMRRSIPFQLTRFALFNVRIMKMVAKGH